MEALAHPVFPQLGVLAAAHLLEIGDDFLGQRGERTREPTERWEKDGMVKIEQNESFCFPPRLMRTSNELEQINKNPGEISEGH